MTQYLVDQGYWSYINNVQERGIEEVDSTYPTKGIQTFGKKTESIEEPSEEGGASMTNKIGKCGPLHAIIVGSSTIAKRSVENKEASRLPQVDSQTTPPTPNTTTMVDYS